MNILEYNQLDYTRVKKQYHKVVAMLKDDNFYSAEVKKIANTPYYRAKLDYANRLLFQIVTYRAKKYALILEVIYNHDYGASKFLNGATVNEAQVTPLNDSPPPTSEAIPYINENVSSFNILDKIISFDDAQYEIYQLHVPLIIIGSAGSGKTVLTLEKMKECYGDILYITHSQFLVESSRNLYYSHQYSNEEQNIDFLSYRELLETVKVPAGKEINNKLFTAWLTRHHRTKLFNDANKLYEEFKGVITGSNINKKYLTKDEYCALGIKQSIFPREERELVYELFEKYLKFLAAEQLYDSNIISFEYLELCQPQYDFIVVDEVQDFTNIQLYFILKMLKTRTQFILSGDANQIVHPNFFSWAKIKTMFYEHPLNQPENQVRQQRTPADIIRILYRNYRNSPEVTTIANNILKLKNLRFGSIDKESNYLVESITTKKGNISLLSFTNKNILLELNNKTRKSTKYAIIVLHEDLKKEARQYFQNPLVFSIQEAKGLEYPNIILFNFISCEAQKFHELTKGVAAEDLTSDLSYARVKDKSDRSLEIYKFYINSLYVAITRAIDNIYIIEDTSKHNLIEVLGLKDINNSITLSDDESSLEEWRREARKLELQGKTEQAEGIKTTIFQQKAPPWQPIDKKQLATLQQQAFAPAKADKNSRLLLFEYAVVYEQNHLIAKLRELNFKSAYRVKQARDIIERKYYGAYCYQSFAPVIKDTNTYGIDFRNQFNQTPVMLASSMGHIPLVEYLVANGADTSLVDNLGRNALQTALLQAYFNPKYAQTKLAELYKLLASSSISIKVDDKLIKIDNHLMEFFLFNLTAAITPHNFYTKPHYLLSGFSTKDFLDPLAKFPQTVLLARRKKRNYISSILAKNEVNRDDKYNRRLFLRIGHGRYILNPQLVIKINEEWYPVYALMGIKLENLPNSRTISPLALNAFSYES